MVSGFDRTKINTTYIVTQTEYEPGKSMGTGRTTAFDSRHKHKTKKQKQNEKKTDEINWYISVEKEQTQHKNASTEFMSRICSIDQLSQTRMEQAYPANGPGVEKNKSISVVKAKNIVSFRNYIKRVHIKYR